MTAAFRSRGPRVGLAIASGGVHAVRLGFRGRVVPGCQVWTRELEAPVGAAWPDLRQALHELGEVMRLKRARVTVLLLPPLVDVRRLVLPRMRPREMREVLAREAARHFPFAAGPQVAAAEPVRRGRASPRPVLAVAAGSDLVDAIHAAVRDAGWSLEALRPAHAAWSAGARAVAKRRRKRARRFVLVLGDDRIDLLLVARDELRALRRLPARAAGSEVAAVARAMMSAGPNARDAPPSAASPGDDAPNDAAGGGREPIPVMLWGEPARCAALADALRQHGIGAEPPARYVDLAGRPQTLAAAFAAKARSHELFTEAVEEARDRRARRRTLAIWAAAAMLFAVAAGLELWGVQRELAFVRARRAAVSGAVAEAMTARNAVADVRTRLSSVAGLERAGRAWGELIADLAQRLPPEVHLTAFRAEADSITLEGIAARAAKAFEAVRASTRLQAARVSGPVRRETRSGEGVVEAFRISADVAPPAGPET